MTRDELLERYRDPIPVLDHGHVRLVDVLGDDERVEATARLSYQKGTRKVTETRGLIRYLVRNRHTSPLEQAVITLDMKMPIFVARQLVRHRTQSLNELSARYSELPEEVYLPDPDQVCHQDHQNRQGRAEPVGPAEAAQFRTRLRGLATVAFEDYRDALQHGVARETARMGLPLSTYTQWCTTLNLHNLLHMLELRLDRHAQWETRQYAEAIARIVQDWVPLTWEAFRDYRLEAATFSRLELEVLRALLGDRESSDLRQDIATHGLDRGMSVRERDELAIRLGVSE